MRRNKRGGGAAAIGNAAAAGTRVGRRDAGKRTDTAKMACKITRLPKEKRFTMDAATNVPTGAF